MGSHPDIQPVHSAVAAWDVFERLLGLGVIPAEQLTGGKASQSKEWLSGEEELEMFFLILFSFLIPWQGSTAFHTRGCNDSASTDCTAWCRTTVQKCVSAAARDWCMQSGCPKNSSKALEKQAFLL